MTATQDRPIVAHPKTAQITASAAAEMYGQVRGLLGARSMVTTMLMIAQNPAVAGTALGTDGTAYYAHIGTTQWVVLYTYDGTVTITAIRRVVSL